jgi:hypothetical protein
VCVFIEAKEQILANLANFAYDPINYDTLFELHVPDLFIDALDEPNPKFFEFAIAGICNCCLGKYTTRILVLFC